MTYSGWKSLALIALGACTLISGCFRSPGGTVRGISQSHTGWSGSRDDGVPGIDAASLYAVTLKYGPPAGVSFALWTDSSNGLTGHGGTNPNSAGVDGTIACGDGSQVKYHCETTDGLTGVMTIGGTDYPLSNGAVFLISTREAEPIVKQLPIDPTSLPKGSDKLQEFARSNAEIAEFFQSRAEPEAE